MTHTNGASSENRFGCDTFGVATTEILLTMRISSRNKLGVNQPEACIE